MKLNLASNKLLPAVFASLLLFAFFYSFVGANFIRDCATARADGTPDECAFSASEERSGYCAACCGAADDLCSGVVAMVMGGLRPLGSLVALRLALRPLRKT